MYEVYLVTNLINGKRYVGITSQGVEERFKQHMWDAHKGSKTLFHNAIRKYGVENFKLETLESNIPDDLAGEREQHYIKAYDSYYPSRKGYNMTEGGNGTVGYIFTEADRAKLSEANKGRKFSEERNQRIREMMTGREYKQEWKDALSQSRLGRFTKQDNPFYGKHHSEATKQTIRENNSGDKVLQLDNEGNVIQEFFNLMDAGRWASENVSKAKYTTCATRIREVCNNSNKKCTAYGYRWQFKGRSID